MRRGGEAHGHALGEELAHQVRVGGPGRHLEAAGDLQDLHRAGLLFQLLLELPDQGAQAGKVLDLGELAQLVDAQGVVRDEEQGLQLGLELLVGQRGGLGRSLRLRGRRGVALR